jgi:hypothetical protein
MTRCYTPRAHLRHRGAGRRYSPARILIDLAVMENAHIMTLAGLALGRFLDGRR